MPAVNEIGETLEATMSRIGKIVTPQRWGVGNNYINLVHAPSRPTDPPAHLVFGVLNATPVVPRRSLETHNGYASACPSPAVQVIATRIGIGGVMLVMVATHIQDRTA